MTDDELLAGLREVFDARDPADGLDRSNGYGTDHTIVDLEVETGDDGFDDLLVTVDRAGDGPVVARLLFDRAWRESSGLDDVRAYAAYVVARWQWSVDDTERSMAEVADSSVQDLEETLRGLYGNANRLRHDVVEVVEDDGEIFFVQATPQEWSRFAGSRPDAAGEIDETIGSRWDDEQHVVFFRGAFHASIRTELPPVRSMLLRDPV